MKDCRLAGAHDERKPAGPSTSVTALCARSQDDAVYVCRWRAQTSESVSQALAYLMPVAGADCQAGRLSA